MDRADIIVGKPYVFMFSDMSSYFDMRDDDFLVFIPDGRLMPSRERLGGTFHRLNGEPVNVSNVQDYALSSELIEELDLEGVNTIIVGRKTRLITNKADAFMKNTKG